MGRAGNRTRVHHDCKDEKWVVAAAAADALIERVEREGGQDPALTSSDTWMRVAAHACRAELAHRMNQTLHEDRGARRVHYLSMEFLMGVR